MKNLFDKLINDAINRREADARRYADHDSDLCMVCHAYGADKRSLFIECGYSIHEVVPAFIDTTGVPDVERGYYLNICKSCRAELLTHLEDWFNERAALRNTPKDHDGDLLDDHEGLIPVRIHGAIRWMSDVEYAAYRKESEDA